MTAARTTSIAVADAHFDVQMLVRETGFEATQPSVPRSRSVTSRLIAAKIATMMKICDATASRTLSAGTSESAFAAPAASSGKLLMISELIQEFAAARAMKSDVTITTTQARLPLSHSATSLRKSARMPRNGPEGARRAAAGEMLAVVMPHAPSY